MFSLLCLECTKVLYLRFSSQFAFTLWVFRCGRGAASTFAHAAVDAAAAGGCPASGLGSQPAARLAPTRSGEGQSYSWWPLHSMSPGGWAPAALQGLHFHSRGRGPALRPGGLASWQRSLLGFCTSRPSQVGTQSCRHCGALFLGILPESPGLCGGLGVQHPAVGDLGQRAGRPCLLGLASSPRLLGLFSGSWFSSRGH